MNNCDWNYMQSNAVTIMQGDQYGLTFYITDDEDAAIPPGTIDDIEIVFGQLTKRLSTGELYFEGGRCIFPLTQDETFIVNYPQETQVRVKFVNGDVVGTRLGKINITESRSKEVL